MVGASFARSEFFLAPAVNYQRIFGRLETAARNFVELVDNRAEPVGFLDAQFAHAVNNRVAVSERRRNGNGRNFVD